MVDEQLLSAIGNLMDQKLEPIHKEINEMKADISELKGNISVLKEDVAGLKDDVTVLKEDVSGFKEDITILREDVERTKDDVICMKYDMSELREDVRVINNRIIRVEIVLENDINRQVNILAEGHMDNTRKVDQISDDVADMKEKISVLYTISQRNVREIRRLNRVK